MKLYIKDNSSLISHFTETHFLQAAAVGECKCFPEYLDMGLDWKTGLPILIMAHAGEDIGTYLEHHPTMLLTMVFELAVAIDQCHRLGYAHCGVKTANVLVNTSAGRPQTTLIGFSAARTLSSFAASRYSVGQCDPKYDPPEVLTGVGAEHAAKLDPWSLGYVVYELLTGKGFLVDKPSDEELQHLTPRELNKVAMQRKAEKLIAK